MKIKLPLLAGFTLLLALAACGSSGDKDKDAAEEKDKTEEPKKEEAKKDEKRPICPQVAIIRELETDRDFGGEKPDPSQLVSAAHMKTVSGNCAYQDEGVDVAFAVDMVAARGPRLGSGHAEFPFFVAVVDPSGAVLNKESMSAAFSFKDEENISQHTEPLHVFIPLAKEQIASGPSYQVLTGFQLTDDQLKIIRAQEPGNPARAVK